ncbi:hypothetical protein B296_00006207 [Ensete ventricosum]|uniref:Uncharacterized protein n=1 Tax=Ensete ventricosum TaxID=4639 RepID=A0A427B8F1_ENSVE|nr:hypothetical protein B296_00006207 [Ensete ventricosum]
MSSSGSSSVKVVPSTSSEGTWSDGPETSILGSSCSGIPSPEDTRSRRDLEIMKSCHDIASVISEEALESIGECHGFERSAQETQDVRWKSAPAVGPESTQLEVKVIHMETSAKRPIGSPVADQATTGRPSKRVKIAVRKHKSRHDEGSSRWATREREPEVSAEGSSLTYRRPKSMKDLCGMRVRALRLEPEKLVEPTFPCFYCRYLGRDEGRSGELGKSNSLLTSVFV